MTERASPLRQRMIDDMTIRNMSLNTQKAYVRAVKNFSLHFRKSPDRLTRCRLFVDPAHPDHAVIRRVTRDRKSVV